MGLAISQIRLLTLTARKADVELGISIDASEKLALTREQTNLAQEYQSRLQSKKIAYYDNGKYNKITYGYLMGYGSVQTAMAIWDKSKPLKEANNMILTDTNGMVIMNNEYASILKKVLGDDCMNSLGKGSTFSKDQIPAIIAELLPGFTPDIVKKIHDGEEIESSYLATLINTLSGESTGEKITEDNSEAYTEKLKQVVDFFYPIFIAAAANGWTTEYNNDMATNPDYMGDALVSGIFQLAEVDEYGNYDPNTSLTYFIMQDYVQERTDSDAREEITAWYNAEKARISEKESWLDLEMNDLSTELEAINTEMEAIKTYINNAVDSVFSWGSK